MRSDLAGRADGARWRMNAELADAQRSSATGRSIDSSTDRLRAAKGGLTIGDRALLRVEAVKLGLTADDLDRLAEPIPPRPEARRRGRARPAGRHPRPDHAAADPRGPGAPPPRRLYEAPRLSRDAPIADITARADAERRRWMQKAQVTAEKTACSRWSRWRSRT